MFVDTGVAMEAGKSYAVSFEASRLHEEGFEVVLQNKQWDEARYQTLYTPVGNAGAVIHVSEENQGTLWIYVQLGNTVNEITLSNIRIQEI